MEDLPRPLIFEMAGYASSILFSLKSASTKLKQKVDGDVDYLRTLAQDISGQQSLQDSTVDELNQILRYKVSLVGKWYDSYGDLGESWCDGTVAIWLNSDMTYTGERQENSGREDPGRTHDFNGTWKESQGSIILSPSYGDFESDLILK